MKKYIQSGKKEEKSYERKEKDRHEKQSLKRLEHVDEEQRIVI